jgi:GNAT superfamily N-acetyltransferase
MSTAAVRLAREEDAEEIARIQRDTWRTAYGELLGDRALARVDAAEVTQSWAAAIAHPSTWIFVATEGSFVVGFCTAGPAPESEITDAQGKPPSDAEQVGLIASFLVEPRWGRRGHGGRLMGTAAATLSEHGAQRGVFWAPQQDAATLGFFRRIGWKPDGTVRTLDTGDGTVRELRLTGELGLKLAHPNEDQESSEETGPESVG